MTGLTTALLLVGTLNAAPESGEPLKLAVVVGSRAGVGNRPALRFAHEDARAFAAVLEQAAGFAPEGVALLLEPTPTAVLEALDAARARAHASHAEALLVFYYSGHTDSQALYPGGEPLALERLKERLADDALGVRIGVIDGCHGGGWTQAKGLKPTAPFEVSGPTGLGTEGLALLSASSGAEDAHETEALQGSFFTHYLIAGLRGAADKSGDGQVTLSEAIAYASRLTIRDTAARAPEPQHPSFDLRLRGRQDIVLSAPASVRTLLTLNQLEGPLELVELSTGVVVLEATPGRQRIQLAVAPGDYLVRTAGADGMRSREVVVRAGEAAQIDEASLTLRGDGRLGAKGPDRPLKRFQVGLQTGATLTDPFAFGLKVEVRAEWRFARRLAMRVRSAYHQNFASGFALQLERDFGVLPTNVTAARFFAGADAVLYPWWSDRYSDGFGVALQLSVGGGVAGIAPLDGWSPLTVAPLASAEVGLSVSLGRTGLFIEVVVTEHLGLRNNRAWPFTNIGLGLAWAFG